MIRSTFLLPLLCVTLLAHGQVPESDTLLSPERLTAFHERIDSIYVTLHIQTDSVQSSFSAQVRTIDSLLVTTQKEIDSLTQRGQSISRHTGKLDSIARLQINLVNSIDTKLAKIKTQALPHLEQLNLPPQLQQKGPFLLKDIDDFQVKVKSLNDVLDGLPADVAGIDGLEVMQNKIIDVSMAASELRGYQEELRSLSNGKLNRISKLSETLEERAIQLTGIDELAGQAPISKGTIELIKDPDGLKKAAIVQAKEAVVDHFADKQKELQGAMETISMLKKKYLSLNSLSEIPEKRPNEMRGKPVIERLLPGIAIQVQKKLDYVLTDFNLYLGYRFTPKITAGGGWNQRVGYDTQKHRWVPEDIKIFGPRIFGEYNLSKGFAPRIELEAMNTFVPPYFKTGTVDPGAREWVWGAFAGMKKDYKFFKKIRGTTQVMFRLFDPHRKSPYADVLNVRFGFELPVKKKADKQAKKVIVF